MILAGAMVALSQSWNGSLFAFRKSQYVNTIVGLLKKKTVELEIKYKAKGFSEIPESDGGDFGSDFPDFTWQAETKDLEFPDLSPILVSQEGGANELLLTVVKQMTEYISKATKEMKVTVIWKSGKNEIKYSVTTYLVNNEAGSIGMGGAGAGGAPPPPPDGSKPKGGG